MCALLKSLTFTHTIPSQCEEDHFNGKIWLFVDGDSYSTSDAFVNYCKQTGFATVVGTRTSGNDIGAEPLRMVLPYSGLIINYAASLAFNPDGTCNETSGTLPDITPADGVSALQTCLDAIQES